MKRLTTKVTYKVPIGTAKTATSEQECLKQA